jgi:hypothetical protein
MRTPIDVGEVAEALGALRANPGLSKIVVVVPLAPGTRELARAALAEGPPFDPAQVGLDAHEVLLTDAEAIFVFGLSQGADSLDRILASEEFWSVVPWWEDVAAGRPRLGVIAYQWPGSPTASP